MSEGARRLALLRHAQAGARDIPDHERALAPQGRRQCPQVAEHLRDVGLLPELVLCSSAVRTRETWELVARVLPEATPEVRVLDELYLGEVGDVLGALAEVSDDVGSVIVVGHEPTMSETAAWLAGPGSDAGALALARVGVPTAALAVLETDTGWADLASHSATLTGILTPV